MRQDFVQVKPDNGYLIHAVRADAPDMEDFGRFSYRWSKHGPICRKIQVRDAQRLPNLSFQFDENRNKKPFDEAFVLETSETKLCKYCTARVMWTSE